MNSESPVDFIVTKGPIYTSDPDNEWIEAFAVSGGRISAVGDESTVRSGMDPDTPVVDLQGRLAMPGLVDGHVHLGLGGRQAAFELPLLPTDSPVDGARNVGHPSEPGSGGARAA